MYDAVCHTCTDRWRIPWCSGQGALRVNEELGVPLVVIPSAILLATINSMMTVIMLTLLPVIILSHYRCWTHKQHKPRTIIFYMSGLISTWLMMAIFLCVVTAFRKILLWELMLLMSTFIIMMYALYQAKTDPGIVSKSNHYSNQSYAAQQNTHTTTVEINDQTKNFLVNNFGLGQYVGRVAEMAKEQQEMSQHCIPQDQVTWVDSRPLEG